MTEDRGNPIMLFLHNSLIFHWNWFIMNPNVNDAFLNAIGGLESLKKWQKMKKMEKIFLDKNLKNLTNYHFYQESAETKAVIYQIHRFELFHTHFYLENCGSEKILAKKCFLLAIFFANSFTKKIADFSVVANAKETETYYTSKIGYF